MNIGIIAKVELHTLKKFTNGESSGTSVEEEVAKDGSSGPSITPEVDTASSSSNSLHSKINFGNRKRS